MNIYEPIMAGAIIGRYLSSTSTCPHDRIVESPRQRASFVRLLGKRVLLGKEAREEKHHYVRYRLCVPDDSTSVCHIINAKREGRRDNEGENVRK